jgi:hypothetical protein
MPTKLDAVIAILLVATAAMAIEDRNRSEISPPPSTEMAFLETGSAGTLSNDCAAAIAADESEAARRMTMIALGIAVPERRPRSAGCTVR